MGVILPDRASIFLRRKRHGAHLAGPFSCAD
jgi:hypothetical protein